MRLDAKRPRGPEPRKRVTRCPACGFAGIEWRIGPRINLHTYICPHCGYEGTALLETDAE